MKGKPLHRADGSLAGRGETEGNGNGGAGYRRTANSRKTDPVPDVRGLRILFLALLCSAVVTFVAISALLA